MFKRCVAAAAAAGLLAIPLPVRAASFQAEARDVYFTPKYLVLEIGDTVRWENTGVVGHTVTSYPDAPASFDSSPETTNTCEAGLPPVPKDCMDPGDDYRVQFEKLGTYDYYCKLHANPDVRPDPSKAANEQPCGMCGRVVVKQAKSPATTPTKSRKPKPTFTPTGTGSATPTATPTDAPTTEPTGGLPTTTGTPVASGSDDPGGGGGGRVGLAVFAILLLSGAGYFTWRRFLGST